MILNCNYNCHIGVSCCYCCDGHYGGHGDVDGHCDGGDGYVSVIDDDDVDNYGESNLLRGRNWVNLVENVQYILEEKTDVII